MSRSNTKREYSKKKLIAQLCIAAIAIVGIFCGLYYAEEREYKGEEVSGDLSDRFDNIRTVSYNGQQFIYNEKLETILFMGIDKSRESEQINLGLRNGGQADFLMLAVIDRDAKVVRRIQIDRDTLTPITTLGILGNVTGTRTAQISLSHAFGDGGKQSCELTVSAVENLLGNIDIDFYVAMDIDAISKLNDKLGGVTVTLPDDFSMLDPEMTKGATIRLQGEQAEYFVRGRIDIGGGTNEERMSRQQVFLNSAMELIDAGIADDPNYVGAIFDAIKEFVTTNMLRGRMANEAYRAVKYARMPLNTIDGTYSYGEDGFMEFTPNSASIEKLVIDMFFQPKK